MHLHSIRTSLVSLYCLAINLPGLVGFRTTNSGVKSAVYSGNIGVWSGVWSRGRANWYLDARKKKKVSLGDKVKVVVLDSYVLCIWLGLGLVLGF